MSKELRLREEKKEIHNEAGKCDLPLPNNPLATEECCISYIAQSFQYINDPNSLLESFKISVNNHTVTALAA